MDAGLALLSEALGLWRGPALADVPASPTVSAAVARLEQARLDALERRLGAELDAGRHGEVVDASRQLVDERPLREEAWAKLLVALYRSGLRVEALEAYRQARDVLVGSAVVHSVPGPDVLRKSLGDAIRSAYGDERQLFEEQANARSVLFHIGRRLTAEVETWGAGWVVDLEYNRQHLDSSLVSDPKRMLYLGRGGRRRTGARPAMMW